MHRLSRPCALGVVALLAACAAPLPPAEEPSEPTPVAEPQPLPQPAPAPAPIAAPKPAPPAPSQPPQASAPPKAAASPPPPIAAPREELQETPQAAKKVERIAAPGDIWQRIRDGFAMPNLTTPAAKKKTAEYAANREYLQRMFDRSRIYLFHIVEEIEKRGLPTELALLPMVESAFNPMAYSRAHASGIWQFVPGTGRRFDLKQNWWYDGRRDIVDSTNAALDYLTRLHHMHGDWHLALASYNWGENAVARAIAKNRKARKPTDYSSLKMPRETRQYVPKLQALKNIIANPAPYGIVLEPIPNEPYFAVVREHPDIDLALAARLAEMPLEEFVALNPGFSRPLIRASVAARIVLPADKVEVFHDNLAKHDPQSLVSWQVYYPQRGETFATLAKKFGVAIDDLKRVNGVPKASSRLPALIVVPKSDAANAAAKLPIMYAPPIPSQGPVRHVHVVRTGDTLGSIATRYRVRVSELKAWNRLGRFLQIGEKIYIRGR